MSATITVPARTVNQRMTALTEANRIRTHRARLKRDIAADRSLALDCITDPEHDVETMKVLDVLLAMPKTGRVKANRYLKHCAISPSKTLGGLSDRQRQELAALLP
jgi:hypothetical protein